MARSRRRYDGLTNAEKRKRHKQEQRQGTLFDGPGVAGKSSRQEPAKTPAAHQAAPAPTQPASTPAKPWVESPSPEAVRIPQPGDADLTAIESAWLEFHAKHPTVLSLFIGEALCDLDVQIGAGVPSGYVRLSAKGIYERLRRKLGPLGIELNNNFTSLYARKAMAESERLAGRFAVRRRQGEK